MADSGRVVTDAGGGLSGGYEVRGPVTPPPAEVTWKNDDPRKPDPRADDLSPGAQKTMRDVKNEVPQLKSINANSGQREDGGPHSTGRAVDINNINGVRVKDLQSGSGEKAEQAREAAANLEKWAEDKDEIKQFIGPNGGWTKDSKDRRVPIEKQEVLDAHKNHYHITTKW